MRKALVSYFSVLAIATSLLLSAKPQDITPAQAPKPTPPQKSPAPAAPAFLVMIDPGHGGSDAGSRITSTLAEKDITLSLARKLREELQGRHVDVKLLRDSDSDLTLDQRAVATNLARPAMFLTLHAEPATRLRIYTSALPVLPSAPMEHNSFLPWQSAQAAFANGSKALSVGLAESLSKRKIAAQIRPAFLEPLHSIAAASLAIEVPVNRRGVAIAEDQLVLGLADAIVARRSNEGPR
jgi:N-acetylmuramoyl-L-alanine amidase